MKSTRWHVAWSRSLLLFLLAAALARSASAQFCWNVAGGTATVSTANLSIAAQDGTLGVSSTAPLPAIVNGRYSVTGIEDFALQATPVLRSMAVRYRDNGSEARVRIFLREQSLVDGSSIDIMTFDSDAYPAGTDYQYREVNPPLCNVSNAFNFLTKLYLVRVELTKSGSGGTPSLHMLSVCLIPC